MNLSPLQCVAMLAAFAVSGASADDASWMEDHKERLKNLPLQELSVPASHDAGMYKHDSDLFEIGLEDLHIEIVAFGGSLLDVGPITGILLGEEFLPLLDTVMEIVNPFDEYCIEVADVDVYCFGTGIAGAVANWVDQYYEFARGAPGELSITQNLSIYGQLSSGVRMFDLRPKALNDTIYLHHSQGNVDIGDSVDWSYDLEFYVPCVERWLLPGCRLGTGRWYDFGTFAFRAGGKVMSFSATGPSLDEVLDDVARYLQEGHKELVVLDFSHYWKGFNGSHFGATDYDQFVALVEQFLGPWMLTSDMVPGGDLAAMTMQELLGQQGRVIVNVETNDSYAFADPAAGFWDAGDSLFNSAGSASEKDDLTETMNEQRSNWEGAGGDRFELWWTLTCQPGSIDCSVRDLASEINPELQGFVDSLTMPNANGNYLNEIWVDFSEETAATAIAIAMNPQPIPIAVSPVSGNGPVNMAMPVDLTVAIYSDMDSGFDAAQLDMSTVMLGRGQARSLEEGVMDMNGDGVADRLSTFSANDAAIACGDSSVKLTGQTFDGQNVAGSGKITTVGCPAPESLSGGGAYAAWWLLILLTVVGLRSAKSSESS